MKHGNEQIGEIFRGPNLAAINSVHDVAGVTILYVLFDERLSGKLEKIGEMPLPPYINHKLEDQNRYQTVYAEDVGSAAAPTAGLHFTTGLIESLKQKGIGFEKVTLHVGLDTFAPVTVENVVDHHIHTEWCQMSASTAQKINETIAYLSENSIGDEQSITLRQIFASSIPDSMTRIFEVEVQQWVEEEKNGRYE